MKSWLNQLPQGSTFISNGPLLEFSVADQPIGGTVKLNAPADIPVRAIARGRVNFKTLELIQNGTVISTIEARPVAGHFEAELKTTLRIDAPCWLALRTPPPPLDKDPENSPHGVRNELGRWLFAHTSPIHVELQGRKFFDRTTAQQLLADLRQAQREIRELGTFADDSERARVIDVYLEAEQQLQSLLKTRK